MIFHRLSSFISLFILCFLSSGFYGFSQDNQSVKVSDAKIKNAARALSIFRQDRIVAVVAATNEKSVYHIHEEDIGNYIFIQYDHDMKVQKTGKVVFPGKDGTYYSQIRKVIYRNNSFYVYYETNNRKNMTYVFVQRFNLNFETSGPRILICKKEIVEESLLMGTGFQLPGYGLYLSDNMRFLGLTDNQDKKLASGEKYKLKSFWMVDLDNGSVKSSKDSFLVKEQNRTYFDTHLSNEGAFYQLFATWRPGGDGKDYHFICRAFKDNNQAPVDAILPIQDIWISDCKIRVDGDNLTLVATYQNKIDKYEIGKFPQEVLGCSVSRFSLSQAKELTNSKVEFGKVFTGKLLSIDKNGSVKRFKYSIHQVFQGEDGSLDVFLKGTEAIEEQYRIEEPGRMTRYGSRTRYVGGYLPVLFRFDSRLASKANHIFNTSPGDNGDLQQRFDLIPFVKGKTFSFVTLTDATIPENEPEFKTAGKFKDLAIATFSVDEDGIIKRSLGAPFLVQKKLYMSLEKDVALDVANQKMFFFSKEMDRGVISGDADFYLSAYQLP